MRNSEFIKKYGIKNFKSIVDGVKENLIILHYNKEIPKYKVNKRKKQIEFYSNGKFITFDIAEIFYMSNKEIISVIRKWEKEV